MVDNRVAKSPPERITYKGHVYENTAHYAREPQAKKEAEEARKRGMAVLIRHHYIIPKTEYDYYVLYMRRK